MFARRPAAAGARRDLAHGDLWRQAERGVDLVRQPHGRLQQAHVVQLRLRVVRQRVPVDVAARDRRLEALRACAACI